jgi:hypothetical protein
MECFMKNRIVQAALLLLSRMVFILTGCASGAPTSSRTTTTQRVPGTVGDTVTIPTQTISARTTPRRTAPAVPIQETPAAPAYKIGDTGPAGGIIFYVKDDNSNGWRYLEAAPAETEQQVKGIYSNQIFRQYKLDDRRLGAGRENTQIFTAFFEQEGGGINSPMWICKNLVVNGFGDWYLPSQDELLCLHAVLYKQELGGFRTMWYLSSTAVNGVNIAVNFASGREAARSGGEVGVRAVRQF